MTYKQKERLAEALHNIMPWIKDALAVLLIALVITIGCYLAFSLQGH